VVTLRGNRFDNPAGLVELIQKHAGTLKLRPDQRLVYLRDWEDEKTRLKGVAGLMQALAKLARAGGDSEAPPMPAPTPELVKTGAVGRR
jgi:transcription-repair coupling factor (superfamily II helicase)